MIATLALSILICHRVPAEPATVLPDVPAEARKPAAPLCWRKHACHPPLSNRGSAIGSTLEFTCRSLP